MFLILQIDQDFAYGFGGLAIKKGDVHEGGCPRRGLVEFNSIQMRLFRLKLLITQGSHLK